MKHLLGLGRRLVYKTGLKKKQKVTKNDVNVYRGALAKASYDRGNGDFYRLFNEFDFRGLNLKKLGKGFWLNFFKAATSEEKERYEHRKEIIHELEEIDFDILKHFEWIHLYAFSMRMGFFDVALTLRERLRAHLLEKLEKKAVPRENEKIRAITGCLENHDLSKFNNLLKEHCNDKEALFYYYNDLNKLINNDSYEVDPSVHTQEDEAFKKFIEGKSVAVVGPASFETMDAEEIDSFDVVVKFNVVSKDSCIDERHKGLRCDVTSYTLAVGKLAKQSSKNELPNDLQWLVCNSESQVSDFKRDYYSLSVRKRYNYASNITFYSKLNHLPKMVLDLLRFNPDQIKIFHSDLYLTSKKVSFYSDKVGINFANIYEEMAHYLNAFSTVHDPITSFSVLKILYNKGKFTGDPVFESVMKMNENQFMNGLQEIYGPFGKL